MPDPFHILVCDDDAHFATNAVAEIQRRLVSCDLAELVVVQPLSNVVQLQRIAADPASARQWQVIFCDLGWGNLTLEGIQLLHDMQFSNPNIFTVLYTAQKMEGLVGQTLEWKLHFIDRVLPVDPTHFYVEVVAIITERLQEHRAPDGAIAFTGLDRLPPAQRESFVAAARAAFVPLQHALADQCAAEIVLTAESAQVRLKTDPSLHRQKKYAELIAAVEQFPRVAPHDLVPLAKSAYIAFIRARYGGFPQMAAARGLDLNHLYRVNRRFQNAPFVVFKWETIQEIIGSYDAAESLAQVRPLLCPLRVLRTAAK